MFVKKELIAGIIITSAVFLTTVLLPAAGFLIGMFAPLSVLFFSRSNRLQGILVLILSLIPVAFVLVHLKMAGTLPLMVCWGAIGLVLSEFFRRRYPLDRAVLYTVLIVLALGAGFVLFLSLQSGEDPRVWVKGYIRQGVQEGIRVFGQSGQTPEQLKQLQAQAPEIIKTVYNLFPATVVICSIFFVWSNVMAARLFFSWKKETWLVTSDLGLWKLPDKLVWLVIAAGGMMVIPVESTKIAGLNLISIFLFAYFFQGLSIIHFFFERKQVPSFFRGISYALIFVQQLLSLIVIGLGFSDIWIDYRKMNRKADLSEENGETH